MNERYQYPNNAIFNSARYKWRKFYSIKINKFEQCTHNISFESVHRQKMFKCTHIRNFESVHKSEFLNDEHKQLFSDLCDHLQKKIAAKVLLTFNARILKAL